MKSKEAEYRTEMQTIKLCAHYMRKYNTVELRSRVTDWFDGQLEIGSYLGIPYADLYRKDTDLDALFREAAQRG